MMNNFNIIGIVAIGFVVGFSVFIGVTMMDSDADQDLVLDLNPVSAKANGSERSVSLLSSSNELLATMDQQQDTVAGDAVLSEADTPDWVNTIDQILLEQTEVDEQTDWDNQSEYTPAVAGSTTNSSNYSTSSGNDAVSSGSSGAAASGNLASGGLSATSSDAASTGSVSSSSGGSADAGGTAGETPIASSDSSNTPQTFGGGGAYTVGDKIKGVSSSFLRKTEIDYVTAENNRSKTDVIFQNMSKYDAIWASQRIPRLDMQAWNRLCTEKSDQLDLYYACVSTAREGVDLSYGDQLSYFYIHAKHPEWFLLNDDRESSAKNPKLLSDRILWVSAGIDGAYTNRFYLDFGNEEFREWAVQEVVKAVKGYYINNQMPYFDGLGMDCANIGPQMWGVINERCPHWKYADNFPQWNQDYCEYLKMLKDALNENNLILVVNQNLDRTAGISELYWDRLYDSIDGLITEQALRFGWGDVPYYMDEQWETAIQRHEKTLEQGLINWWVCFPAEQADKGHEDFMYTYCSWLLINTPGKSFYYATKGKGYSSQDVPWYAEYDLPLGVAVSKRYLKDGCWVRDYEFAKVVVNSTSKAKDFEIDADHLWLDWKSQKAVNEIQLPPASATILLPTSYAAYATDE